MFELDPTPKSDTLDGAQLTLDEYQKLAMRTCNIPYHDQRGMLNHGVFGLTSEAGEVAAFLQKQYQGHDIDIAHMKKELGDVMWMVAEICTAIGTTMNEIAIGNIEKLRKRFPDGFSTERSINRAKGDV